MHGARGPSSVLAYAHTAPRVRLVLHQEIGKKIAQLAYGQPEGFEPPKKRFVLDYNELEHWQVDTSQLVEPVSIINEPLSIFTKHQVQLFSGITPPSKVILWFLLKPVAKSCSLVGSGSWSPAN